MSSRCHLRRTWPAGTSWLLFTFASKKMAKARVNSDVQNFIKLVYENPLLWESRRDDYKLAENKPLVWDRVAADATEVNSLQ